MGGCSRAGVLMTFQKPIEADVLYLGMLVEFRFFENIEQEWGVPLPGVIDIKRAAPLTDLRGIDGIVRYRKESVGLIRRIPFQIKLGGSFDRKPMFETKFGFSVPIIFITAEATPRQMRRRLDEHLLLPSILNMEFEEPLRHLECARMTSGEHEALAKMRSCRAEFLRARHTLSNTAFA